MKFAIGFAVGTGLMLASPVLAQTRPAVASLDQMAEHASWAVEHERWHKEHLELANKLEAIAAALRAPDDGLAEHGAELAGHSVTLTKTTDAMSLAEAHAKLRAKHENARIAHHELLDDVDLLARVLREDRTTDTEEKGSAAAQ